MSRQWLLASTTQWELRLININEQINNSFQLNYMKALSEQRNRNRIDGRFLSLFSFSVIGAKRRCAASPIRRKHYFHSRLHQMIPNAIPLLPLSADNDIPLPSRDRCPPRRPPSRTEFLIKVYHASIREVYRFSFSLHHSHIQEYYLLLLSNAHSLPLPISRERGWGSPDEPRRRNNARLCPPPPITNTEEIIIRVFH